MTIYKLKSNFLKIHNKTNFFLQLNRAVTEFSRSLRGPGDQTAVVNV